MLLMLAIPINVPVREGVNGGESFEIYLATVFLDAPQQDSSRPAKGPGPPAGVLATGIALPPLQDPLQRIIDDPPGRV